MSRPTSAPDRTPFIRIVDLARRAMENDMVFSVREKGWAGVTYAHNAVFSTLQVEGSRASDMAAVAGITRQSMGESIRGMVALGFVEMKADPDDKRAKVVAYTPLGMKVVAQGFQHIADLEQQFSEEFGEDYETARRVLSRVVEILTGEPDGG